jgi:hypothetical protein
MAAHKEGNEIEDERGEQSDEQQGPIRFVDMFGGIGGFRLGLERAAKATGREIECVAYYEKDKYAVDSYNEIFGENNEPTDVTQLDAEQVPKHEILCGGFHVNLSALLETVEDSTIREELCSLKSLGLLEDSYLRYYSSRTSKDFLITPTGQRSEQSSRRWMNWGMMQSGRCLTANIMEYRRTESKSSLSRILETDPDPKYFLSESRTNELLEKLNN